MSTLPRGDRTLLLGAVVLLTSISWGADAPPPSALSPSPPEAHRPDDDPVGRILPLTVMIEGDGVYGAGILADPAAGRVLTSLHVIEDMKSPRVTTRDGRKATAKIVAKDTKLDLALLEAVELISPDLERPRFVDVATLRPGEEVYAIGMPRKLPFSVSRGVVGYIDRDMDGGRYVQLDMNINEGNSGGPVFNRHGEVVGVMSFILRRSQGLAFALPALDALAAFNELRPTPPPTLPAVPSPLQRAASAP